MLKKKNLLILDHIKGIDRNGKAYNLPIKNGLVIKKECTDELVDICKIFWSDYEKECYIQTVKNHLQDYIVVYEDYQDFIYLIDEAFYLVSLMNSQYYNMYVDFETKGND